ncbi:unnamed protein product [Adineta ricciae]|uniref:K Homology domain-containing protein n=1 Tax=Adineta ricciae TaxID=249248 RepID=A0A814TKZ6_ADIRI|nr:unnamed protein product [Adineta ricciae]
MDYTHGQSNDYPLRILVPSDSVGAVIGKQGATVKQIKQTTHAKVDVNKSESSNSQERMIVIRGQQENCIQACREVYRIMYEDSKNKNKTNEIVVKVLAHNNFIGRIIGKGGNIINTIKNETETNIAVSNINELNSYNIERVISIKGELEQQMRALEAIYGKLCLAYESDNTRAWNYSSQYYQQQQQLMQHFAQQATVMTTAGPLLSTPHYPQATQPIIQQQPQTNNSNGTPNKYVEQANSNAIYHPTYYTSMFPASGPFYMPYASSGPMISSQPNPYVNGQFPPQQQHLYSLQNAPVAVETVHLYVPNTIIGAIIGSKGLFIKSIIRNSNAMVKIAPLNSDEDQTKIVDRQVTITGTPEAQWKSQYYIYDKIRQEGYAGDDEVRLRAEIFVPTSLIGRLVGKGGHNVRQLQQSTGAIIKLPDDSQQTSASEVPVKIIGSFQASQFAQRRIQSIIQMARDTTTDDQNQSINEQINGINKINLNEVSTVVNGSTISDDAVVASSTLQNPDDSITAADDQKSRVE